VIDSLETTPAPRPPPPLSGIRTSFRVCNHNPQEIKVLLFDDGLQKSKPSKSSELSQFQRPCFCFFSENIFKNFHPKKEKLKKRGKKKKP
jgi:hypothetical protein